MSNIIRTKSTVISSILYEPARQDLTIEFKSGENYLFTPVSGEFFQKMKESKSKGKFFNSNIRNNEALTKMKIL